MGEARKWRICIPAVVKRERLVRLYVVFGNPINHSKSPFLHNFVFERLKIDARYVRFCLEDTRDFREIFFDYGFSGANITVPFKEKLLESCDEVNGIATKIGAINTIIRKDSKLFGYNTDAIGFYKSLLDSASIAIKNALIIGAGGSARAIAFILREHNIDVKIINRSKNRLDFFQKNGFECETFSDFSKCNNMAFDVIINATSSSISDELPLDSAILGHCFDSANIAIDLMYGKKCRFLELAKSHKIITLDGTKMLLYQAIEASNLFLNAHTREPKIAYKSIENAMICAYKNI